jgi:uncharacterized phage infection (PIP) family protein YhgE
MRVIRGVPNIGRRIMQFKQFWRGAAGLASMQQQINQLKEDQKNMATKFSQQLADVKADLDKQTIAVASAVSLIDKGAAPADVQALADIKTAIDANTTSLNAALALNVGPTPPSPTPPSTPGQPT